MLYMNTASIFSVSQNDTFNNCQCEQCKAVDDAEGSPAGSLLKFVNAVAESIEKDHPKIRIDTLAYQYTRKPPKTIRPRADSPAASPAEKSCVPSSR